MQKLFLLAGLPGVGKSTISRNLITKLGATCVDIDDFKKKVVDPNAVTKEIDPPAMRWLYYKKAIEYVLGLFGQGIQIVVMDEVFHMHSLRTQLERECTEHDIQVIWLEVLCPYETVAKRLRSTGRPGHILSTEEALAMYRLFEDIFEAFPEGANHITVHNDDEVDVSLLLDTVLQTV